MIRFWNWKRNDPSDTKPITIKIKIKTPKGQAKKTALKIEQYILGKKKHKLEKFEVNKEDSIIIWTVRTNLRQAMKINRNVAVYETIINEVWTNKHMTKQLKKKYTKEELKEVKQMLTKQTTVDILKKGASKWD